MRIFSGTVHAAKEAAARITFERLTGTDRISAARAHAFGCVLIVFVRKTIRIVRWHRPSLPSLISLSSARQSLVTLPRILAPAIWCLFRSMIADQTSIQIPDAGETT
jgi:hypothetical protein